MKRAAIIPGMEVLKGYERLLLVEDEAIIALQEASVLRNGGYIVKTLMSGEDAVALVKEDASVDLILMDIDLNREMDGTRAAELILRHRDIPIVFMSSHSEPEIIHRIDQVVSYGYVVKGSSPIVMFASLRMAVRLHEAKRKIQEHERELVERANEYKWLVESMINAFVVWESVFDKDGRYIDFKFGYFNDAYSRISGLKLDEVRGKRVYGEVWPETEAWWLEVYGRVAITGQAENFEMYHAPTHGRYIGRAYRPWPTQDRICVVFEEARPDGSVF